MERSGNADARSCYASSGFRRLLRTKSRRDRAPTPAIRIRNLRTPSLLHRVDRQRAKPICQVCEERDEIIAARRKGEDSWPVRSLFLIECRFKLTKLLTTRLGWSTQTIQVNCRPNERPRTPSASSGWTGLCSYNRHHRPLWTTPAGRVCTFPQGCANKGATAGQWEIGMARHSRPAPPSHVSNR
jgi:hypothetical protein